MKAGRTPLTMGMPVYNEEKYVGEAIDSLLAQTYKDFILIISDNASTDRTSEICKLYAEKYERIKYIRHSENRGGLFNFKYVLDKADTPYFMWCGGHDRWHHEFVEKLLPIIEKEDIVLVYPRTRKINFDGTVGIIDEDDLTTVNIENLIDRYLKILNWVGSCNIIHGIWRTSTLLNCHFRPIFAPDNLILAQATIEGKFRQYGGILFFRRIIRKDEVNSIVRASCDVTGKKYTNKSSIFLIKLKFMIEYLKILFRRDYPLHVSSRILLSTKTVYVMVFRRYLVLSLLNEILARILPCKVYSFLKERAVALLVTRRS